MKFTPFERKMLDRMCQLLQDEKAATEAGDGDSVMLCRAHYAGFVDAMRMILSERLCVRLERWAVEEVNGIARSDE